MQSVTRVVSQNRLHYMPQNHQIQHTKMSLSDSRFIEDKATQKLLSGNWPSSRRFVCNSMRCLWMADWTFCGDDGHSPSLTIVFAWLSFLQEQYMTSYMWSLPVNRNIQSLSTVSLSNININRSLGVLAKMTNSSLEKTIWY